MTRAEPTSNNVRVEAAGQVTAVFGVLGLIGAVLGIGSIPINVDTFTGVMVIASLVLCPLALILGLSVRRRARAGSVSWRRVRLGLRTATTGLAVLTAGAVWILISAAAFASGG